MAEFLAALTIFLLAHSLPNATGLRARLISRIGSSFYITAYSIVSIALLIWLIIAAQNAPYIELWPTTRFTALFPLVAMIAASILLTSAMLRPNPLSIAFVSKPVITGPGILALLRHPLLWALFLWAASHMVANGDLVSLILFGGLAVFCLAGTKLMERRAKHRLSAKEFASAMAISRKTLSSRLAILADKSMMIEIGAGILLYILLLYAHDPVIGVAPMALVLP